MVAESGEEEESKEEAEEWSAHATQGSISVSVSEAAGVSEVADGLGDVQSASVVEVDEVEVGEKLGGSVVECVSENDVVCEDVQTLSVSSVEDSEEWKEVSGEPGEQLEDEDVQCRDDDLDYVEEEKEEVEEIEPEAIVEEKKIEAEEWRLRIIQIGVNVER